MTATATALKFNSQAAPGSVMVQHDGKTIGMIVRLKYPPDAQGNRHKVTEYIPLISSYNIGRITGGDYKKIKETVIGMFERTQKDKADA